MKPRLDAGGAGQRGQLGGRRRVLAVDAPPISRSRVVIRTHGAIRVRIEDQQSPLAAIRVRIRWTA